MKKNKMHKHVINLLYWFIITLLTACSNDKNPISRTEKQTNELDTLHINDSLSCLEIERFKVLHNIFEKLKLGKISFNIHANDISLHTKGKLNIDSGLIIYNKKYFEAKCYIKTSQILLPVIIDEKINLSNPIYLFPDKFPYVEFTIKGNLFPKTQKPSVAIYLGLNDSTGIIDNNNFIIEKNNLRHFHTEFYLDGKKWGLINEEKKLEVRKDSLVGKLNLYFSK